MSNEMKMLRAFYLCLALFALLAGLCLGGTASAREVAVITIEGVIDPAMADYLERALNEAQEKQVECLVVRLNTPGGLGTSMDNMVNRLLNSRLPVVVYVSPRGASAFSAGTFITLAASFAVMNPDTTIGAAHPRDLFSAPAPQGEEGKSASKQLDAVMEKIINAYATRARTIAEARGRNADWAEKAVRESATVTASEALKLKVVDSLQPNLESLLNWLDGRTVKVEGKQVTLHTKGARVTDIPPSVKDSFLHQLWHPDLLLILMVLAAMGILFELQNPGAILPGVVGGISLLLALYSMSVLPVTTAGVALIVFGLLLFVLDIKLPSHGILTVGGIASFVIGGLMLVNVPPQYRGVVQMSWQLVVGLAVLVAAFFIFAIGAAVRAHLRRPTTGVEGMVGATGKTLEALSTQMEGGVQVVGERWKARSRQESIAAGEKVEVVAVEGLTLIVKRAEKES